MMARRCRGRWAFPPCIIPQGDPQGASPRGILKGAKNIDGAEELLKAFITPENLNAYLKDTRARYLPVMTSVIKNAPSWLDPADPA